MQSTKTVTGVSKQVQDVLRRVDRKQLRNNTQRVLLSLLTTDGWVPRTVLRVPNAAARVRDLRKEEFGGFDVQCATPEDLMVEGRSDVTDKQTFYRLDRNSVTLSAVKTALKGVVSV